MTSPGTDAPPPGQPAPEAPAEQTGAEFDTVEIQAAFWEAPGMITEKGTVYCAGPL